MPKKLIFVLPVFFIAIFALVYVNFFYLKKNTDQFLQMHSPKPAVIPETSLSMTPNSLSLTSGTTALVNIAINTNQIPKVIQLEMSYDPHLLFNVNILPGNYFVNPEIVLENIDAKNGRISYALKGDSINKEASIAATISFNPVNYGSEKLAEIYFLPKTLIRGDNEKIKLDSTSGANILVKPAFFIPLASPSAAVIQ